MRHFGANRGHLLKRLPAGRPYSDFLLQSAQAIIDASESFAKKAAAIRSDTKLSQEGVRAAISEMVRKEAAPRLAALTRGLRKAKQHIQRQRDELQPAATDKADVMGELRRQEVRTYLRGLPPAERITAANEMVADDEQAAAILGAPPRISGLPPQLHGQLRASILERRCGRQLAELNEQERAHDEVSAVALMVRASLASSSGLLAGAFDAEMVKLEEQADQR